MPKRNWKAKCDITWKGLADREGHFRRQMGYRVFAVRYVSVFSFIGVPVIPVKPVKSHLVMVLIESTIGFVIILP